MKENMSFPFTEFMVSLGAVLMERHHGHFKGYRPLSRSQLVLMPVTLVMRSSWHNSHYAWQSLPSGTIFYFHKTFYPFLFVLLYSLTKT